jgi:hypothetical protein
MILFLVLKFLLSILLFINCFITIDRIFNHGINIMIIEYVKINIRICKNIKFIINKYV